MARRRPSREDLADTLLLWGFVLTLAALLGAGCFEAWKVVSVIPAAFESSPAVLRNPMWASGGDSGSYSGSSNRQRAREADRAARQGR